MLQKLELNLIKYLFNWEPVEPACRQAGPHAQKDTWPSTMPVYLPIAIGTRTHDEAKLVMSDDSDEYQTPSEILTSYSCMIVRTGLVLSRVAKVGMNLF
jgi:hypothetical protein